MSRNIFKKRPPASPNKPPPAPAKMLPKGQPVPLNVNFFVQGSTIQRNENARTDSKENRTGNAKVTKSRPHSAHVDKHVLQSMSRSPSVDNSFYDRFERLDRDTVIGDTAFKEKGGRVKSAGSEGNVRKRSSSSRPRRRSKSASSFGRKHTRDSTCSAKKPTQNDKSFFEMAMSFDDETKQNTLTNAVRQISPRTLGIEAKHEHASRRRPRSGRKARERSLSSKRSEGSDSQSSHSVGNTSLCSSSGSKNERHFRKNRSRKSRSRTRRTTPRSSNNGRSSKKSSPERDTRPVRPDSGASQRKRVATNDNIRHKLVIKNLKTVTASSSFEIPECKGDFAYHYTPTGNRPERKSSASKKDSHSVSAIAAVKKANNMHETLKEMKEIDRFMFHGETRPISSKLPKLKMIVAPTAMPLASLVRSTSAKMLMANPYDSRRGFDI